jgi:hypothetical protein
VSVSVLPTACVDRALWPALLAHRFERSGVAEPAAAEAALDHAATCPRCAERALELDPSLMFVRLRAPRVAATADDADADVVAMRQAVAHLRRTSRVESPGGRVDRSTRRASFVPRRFATAAALAALVGTLAWGVGSIGEVEDAGLQAFGGVGADAASPGASFASFANTGAATFTADELDDWRLSPVVEPLDRADARIYKLDEERDLSVTLIVDASFDV